MTSYIVEDYMPYHWEYPGADPMDSHRWPFARGFKFDTRQSLDHVQGLMGWPNH